MKILQAQDRDFERFWAGLLRNHDNPTALISQSHFEYRAHYLGPALEKQICAVAVEGDRPIAGTYFELLRDTGGRRSMDATQMASQMIIARDTPLSLRTGAETLLRKWIHEAADANKVERLLFRDQLIGGGLSPLSHWALEQGAHIEPEFNQIVDLTIDEEALWRAMTKSCQWAVNWGRKHMVLKVRRDHGALEELRRLHFEAAGGTTRQAATWDLQGKMMEEDEAFVVTAELNGDAVSAALFQVSRGDCYYGVSASNRLLFDKPLSHSIIWEAIRHSRQRGCQRFCLGGQVWERYRWHLTAPSRKEANISKFKRSFGGQTRPEFVVILPMAAHRPIAATPYNPGEVALSDVMPAALADPALARGEHVMLRPLTPADVTPRYLNWFADPEVHRYLEVRAISADEACTYIEEGWTKNTYFMCAICDAQTGLHVGNLKIGPIRWQQSVADMVTVIGDKSYWGRQVATEAIRLGSRIAFRTLGLQKLHASMYADNIGSLRAYTRAGWHVEARLKQHSLFDGQPQDTILIGQFNPGER